MADFHKLVDHLFYNGKRGYTRTDGSIDYLDGTGLARPADMPKPQRIFVAVLVVIAIVIGFFIIRGTVIDTLRTTILAEQTINENISRPASIDSIPKVADLINLGDEMILSTLQASGDSFLNSSENSENGNLVVRRAPKDITLDEIANLLTHGVGALNAADATRLLTGSWTLNVERTGATSIVVRYADFVTGNPQTAIQNAMEKEGFDRNSVTESGEDDSGNTFMTGTLVAGDSQCIWRVSALPLDDVYSINGLPEDACYVGVRLTKVGDAPTQPEGDQASESSTAEEPVYY